LEEMKGKPEWVIVRCGVHGFRRLGGDDSKAQPGQRREGKSLRDSSLREALK
jgi:hypothetical protein